MTNPLAPILGMSDHKALQPDADKGDLIELQEEVAAQKIRFILGARSILHSDSCLGAAQLLAAKFLSFFGSAYL